MARYSLLAKTQRRQNFFIIKITNIPDIEAVNDDQQLSNDPFKVERGQKVTTGTLLKNTKITRSRQFTPTFSLRSTVAHIIDKPICMSLVFNSSFTIGVIPTD